MINFQIKPIGGSLSYVVQAIVSYKENRGIKGDVFFEESNSGYLVSTGNSVLFFTRLEHEAYNFIADKLSDFEQKIAISNKKTADD